MNGCRMAGLLFNPAYVVRSDRRYWEAWLDKRADVFFLVSGARQISLIGWAGREFAWLECDGEIMRVFPDGHPGCPR